MVKSIIAAIFIWASIGSGWCQDTLHVAHGDTLRLLITPPTNYKDNTPIGQGVIDSLRYKFLLSKVGGFSWDDMVDGRYRSYLAKKENNSVVINIIINILGKDRIGVKTQDTIKSNPIKEGLYKFTASAAVNDTSGISGGGGIRLISFLPDDPDLPWEPYLPKGKSKVVNITINFY